jgi:hypothetical protein
MEKYAIHLDFFLLKILMCISLGGCASHKHTIKKKIIINPHTTSVRTNIDTHNTTYKPPITIWIHGTHFSRSSLFTYVFKGKPGLKPATEIANHYKARIIANTLNQNDPVRFPLNTFYIFGWSGKLNANLREKTAHHLYAELKRIITEYEQTYHCTPPIQIISHSHGGNVALNLAKIKDPQDSLLIDILVLLACPVQIRTVSFIDNPMFQRIYSLYSSLDFVQVIAPQIYKKNDNSQKAKLAFPPFSNRYFPYRPHITQVKMKVDGNSPWHNDFVKAPFLQLLPSIIAELDSWEPISPSIQIIKSTTNLSPKAQISANLGTNSNLRKNNPITHSLSVHTKNKYFYT